MAKKDPRIDAYIARSAPFARPILARLRKLVHTGCPDLVETIKWGAPAFEYKGPLCGMAAFKGHAVFGFWKHALLIDGKTATGRSTEKAMGQFGRITSVDDLPPERTLLAMVRRACTLNDLGTKVPRSVKPKPRLVVPAYFMAALKQNSKALAIYKGFSPSHRREYVEWVTEARTDATRQRRLGAAVAWMARGRSRNWKYMRRS